MRENNRRRRMLQQQCDSGFNTSVHDSESECGSISESMNVVPNDDSDYYTENGVNAPNSRSDSTINVPNASQNEVADNYLVIDAVANDLPSDNSDDEDTTYNYGNVTEEYGDEDTSSNNSNSEEDDFMQDRQTTQDYSRYRERIFDFSPSRCNNSQNNRKILVEEIVLKNDENQRDLVANDRAQTSQEENDTTSTNEEIYMQKEQDDTLLANPDEFNRESLENDSEKLQNLNNAHFHNLIDESNNLQNIEVANSQDIINENLEEPQQENERTIIWKEVCDRLRRELDDEESTSSSTENSSDYEEHNETPQNMYVQEEEEEEALVTEVDSVEESLHLIDDNKCNDEEEPLSDRDLLMQIASCNYVQCTESQREFLKTYIEEKTRSIREHNLKASCQDHDNVEHRRVALENHEDFERLIQIYAKKTVDEDSDDKSTEDEPDDKSNIEYETFSTSAIVDDNHKNQIQEVQSEELIQLFKKEIDESSSEDERDDDEPFYKKLDNDERIECKHIEFLDEFQEVYEKVSSTRNEQNKIDSLSDIDDVKELLQWELNINKEKVVYLQPRISRSEDANMQNDTPEFASNLQKKDEDFASKPLKSVEDSPDLQNSAIASKSISEIRAEIRKFTENLTEFTKQFRNEYKTIMNKCNEEWNDFVALRDNPVDFDFKKINERRPSKNNHKKASVESTIQQELEDVNDDEDVMKLEDEIEFLDHLQSQEILEQIDLYKKLEPINLETNRPRLREEPGKPRDLYKECYLSTIDINADTQRHIQEQEDPIITKEIKNNVNYLVQNESLHEEVEEFCKNDETISDNQELFCNSQETNETDDFFVNRRDVNCTLEMQLANEQQQK